MFLCHPLPPTGEVCGAIHIDHLPDARRNHPVGASRTLLQEFCIGLLPRVQSKRKLSAVRGQHQTRTNVLRCLRCLVREHMDCMPLHIILSVLHHRKIKAVKACADVLEMLSIAAVTADVDAALRRYNGKAAPLRIIARQKTSRKMLRRQNVDVKIISQRNVSVPVLLVQVREIKAPLLKNSPTPSGQMISFTFGFSAITVS